MHARPGNQWNSSGTERERNDELHLEAIPFLQMFPVDRTFHCLTIPEEDPVYSILRVLALIIDRSHEQILLLIEFPKTSYDTSSFIIDEVVVDRLTRATVHDILIALRKKQCQSSETERATKIPSIHVRNPHSKTKTPVSNFKRVCFINYLPSSRSSMVIANLRDR